MRIINVGIKINYCKAAATTKITYGAKLWNDYQVTTLEDTVLSIK